MGAVSIKVLDDVEATSKCGGMVFKVQWKIDGEPDGWVIQHITAIDDVHRCDGTDVDVHTEEFWEAWRVGAGIVYKGAEDERHEFDLFIRGAHGDGTKGKHLLRGKVSFLENYDLQMSPNGPWKENDIAAAGNLPTSRTAPQGWDEAAALDHVAEDRWNCCGGKGAFPTAVGRALSADCRDDGKKPAPKGEGPRHQGEKVRKVLRRLRSMGAWIDLAPGNGRGRKEVASVLKGFQVETNRTLRAAFAEYLREALSQSCSDALAGAAAASKIFLANRYLFAVPEEVPRGSVPFFGGWRGVPVSETTVNPLWPWSQSAKGALALTGTFAGYMGDAYQALREFDYFGEQFGRRPKK